ncbi:ABC transporter substrate-binding protein [Dactylosporangium sp. NPDC048998]|uniref:ABC transporter substrate-binding protein n=1 Tax=Dactylosporangium sp. NPDC048998 TaxID=3363976 RepID=UPI003719B708
MDKTTIARRTLRRGPAVAALIALTAGLAACSPSASSNDAGAAGDRGPITLATGKDTTGTLQKQLDAWNGAHPDEKVTLIELPTSADQQRQQLVQNAQTKSDAYTVEGLDVVWTAEFAAHRWIDEIPASSVPTSSMIASTVATGQYFGKQYAIPYQTNAGVLFYRKDLLDAIGAGAPKTWSDMQADCAKIAKLPQGAGVDCYAGQFDKYEGLTVNFCEAVQSAGGSVIGPDGKPTLNTPAAKTGLQTLLDAFNSGMISKTATTYKEEDGRKQFQDGNLVFHRQWPYQWDLANKTDGSSKVAGKFAVTALPGIGTSTGSSTLGGLNLAISAYGKHKATAADFIKFLTGGDNERQALEDNSTAPVYPDLYTDPALQAKFPYLATLKAGLDTAVPRPKVANYGDATSLIQNDVAAAISGSMSVDAALADLQSKLTALVNAQ